MTLEEINKKIKEMTYNDYEELNHLIFPPVVFYGM